MATEKGKNSFILFSLRKHLYVVCSYSTSDRKLWLSIIAAGAVGFGAPFVAVPVYSDVYKVAM